MRRLSQLFCRKVGNSFMGGERCSFFLTQSSVLHAFLWTFFWEFQGWFVPPGVLTITGGLAIPTRGVSGVEIAWNTTIPDDGFPTRGIC